MMELRKIPLFRNFSDAEILELKTCIREKTFQKGEIIHHEGNRCERVFIVQEGKVKLSRASSTGKEQVLEVLGNCETCACNPGSADWTCPMSAQATTDCTLMYLSRDHYCRLMKKNLNFAHSVARIFADRLTRFSTLIEQVSLDDVRKRLVKFLLHMRDKNNEKQGDVVSIPYTRQDLAERLGAARETVARHISELRRKNLIGVKTRQIVIRDRAELQRIAQ
jgi:CRP-like cAMP-binding protein